MLPPRPRPRPTAPGIPNTRLPMASEETVEVSRHEHAPPQTAPESPRRAPHTGEPFRLPPIPHVPSVPVPGTLTVKFRDWTIRLPAAILISLLTALGGGLAGSKVLTSASEREMRTELDDLRRASEARDRKHEREQEQLRQYLEADRAWVDQTMGLMTATIGRLGGKIVWQQGADPGPVEFHEAPLRSRRPVAPFAQPKAVIPAPPEVPRKQ